MAGTDHTRAAEAANAPVMVLVEPQMGENIGAVARAMWNFGLDRMRIVNPRDGWPNAKAGAMASGAGWVLDRAQIFATTSEAVGDLNFLFATTARPRGMIKRVMTPSRAAAHAARLVGEGQRVGILFGRERTGLENEDVVRAGAIISVPCNPAFASLNLAQCVLLISHEWSKLANQPEEEVFHTGKTHIAEAKDVDYMLAHLQEELDRAGFFHPPDRRPSMLANLRNLFHRAPLTDQDVRTMRGVIRALSEGRRGEQR